MMMMTGGKHSNKQQQHDSSSSLQALQDTLHRYASIDWSSLAMNMQTTQASISTAKQAHATARKTLADQTKSLKKSVKVCMDNNSSSDANVTTLTSQCKTTVKAYQEEIDALTKRCKTSETTLSSVQAAIGLVVVGNSDTDKSTDEQANPTTILQQAWETISAQQEQMTRLLQTVQQVNEELQASEQKVAQLKQQQAPTSNNINNQSNNSNSATSKAEKEELISLRQEVAEYEVEFRNLKNQDITIRKLEAKISQMEQSAANTVQQEIMKAQDELEARTNVKLEQALEMQDRTQRQYETLQLELQAERLGREHMSSEYLELDSNTSALEAAWEAQRQLLLSDAERVRQELQVVIRQRDDLQVAQGMGSGGGSGAPSSTGSMMTSSGSGSKTNNTPASGNVLAEMALERKAYEAEVSELSETATLLRQELATKQEEFCAQQRQAQLQQDKWRTQILSLESKVASLEQALAQAPHPDEIAQMRKELAILKRLEHGTTDNNHDEFDDDNPEIAGGGSNTDTLEAVLVAKLRKAENDLVEERVRRTNLVTELDELRQEMSGYTAAQEESRALVAKLEADLERATERAPAMIAAAAKAKQEQQQQQLVPANPNTLAHILDPNAEPVPAQTPSETTPKPQSNDDAVQDDHSVATIVMAQRDRLRARCDALEAERDSFKRELQGQVTAMDQLQTDNAKLYEKVRYLQNYSNKNNNNRNRQHASNRDVDLEALEQRYEASVDPFRQFSKAERMRKLQEMSPMERTVFIVAKTFLQTKEMRTALFCYVLALHLLVFITTYHWSHNADCSGASAMINNDHLSHLPPVQPGGGTGDVQTVATKE